MLKSLKIVNEFDVEYEIEILKAISAELRIEQEEIQHTSDGTFIEEPPHTFVELRETKRTMTLTLLIGEITMIGGTVEDDTIK